VASGELNNLEAEEQDLKAEILLLRRLGSPPVEKRVNKKVSARGLKQNV